MTEEEKEFESKVNRAYLEGFEEGRKESAEENAYLKKKLEETTSHCNEVDKVVNDIEALCSQYVSNELAYRIKEIING